MKNARHAFGMRGLSAPDMVAEAVGKHHIGLPGADDLAGLPDGQCVQPVGDHLDLQALGLERFDPGWRRIALAPKHQQRLQAWVVLRGQAQIDRHLRGTRKPAGDEMHHP
ncbi:hypothetical protein D3C71_1794860 [compost metagenome]